jgi:hypothetical protein
VTLANLASDLDVAITRQARMTDPNPGHAVEAPLPFDVRASEAAWVVRNTLSEWVTALANDQDPRPAAEAAPMAVWLLNRIPRIAQHPDATDCLDELAAAATQATRAVDRPPERRYAGPCATCGQPLYVKAGKTTVTCKLHDPPWTGDVEERREWMLSEVAGRLAHAAAAVHVLSLLDVKITAVQVTRWKQAGRLVQRGRDVEGRTLYRIGDLIDLAAGKR